ncbi:MAG: hypothetical protein COV44_05985 [Deltaproteobacteria bacterium CG11_big_fil_rev_8_21_14_0_20_45_16]|nr:MAG: hypothetical protein COV44_05985 [Deltaproteobacteria bacterium CG11_big_fil_rev_8_21_14_0_20_45_16]
MKLGPRNSSSGIALFILLSSLLVIGLAMRDLFQNTNVQIQRVRNSIDRQQSIYLARSTLNLARFFIAFDAFLDRQSKDTAADTLQDYWAQPIPFPIPMELIQGFYAQSEESGNGSASSGPTDEDKIKKCDEFFGDFEGESLATVTDLSSRINLNDLEDKKIQQLLLQLLTPNLDFVARLEKRDIRPEDVVSQIRDYIDPDEVENITNAFELSAYSDAGLPYAPKNRPFNLIDELKLVPIVDNELYDYLQKHSAAVYFTGRAKPAKINLNTVESEVFQALLKDVGNPEEITEAFLKDRQENSRVYTEKSISDQLEAAGINKDNLELGLLTGSSDLFSVSIRSKVNDVEVLLETMVKKPLGKKDARPIVMMRTSP